MKGSEKQIAWAEQIKKEVTQSIEFKISGKLARKDMRAEWYAIVADMRDRALQAINNCEDAKKFIEGWAKDLVVKMEQAIDAEFLKITK